MKNVTSGVFPLTEFLRTAPARCFAPGYTYEELALMETTWRPEIEMGAEREGMR